MAEKIEKVESCGLASSIPMLAFAMQQNPNLIFQMLNYRPTDVNNQDESKYEQWKEHWDKRRGVK